MRRKRGDHCRVDGQVVRLRGGLESSRHVLGRTRRVADGAAVCRRGAVQLDGVPAASEIEHSAGDRPLAASGVNSHLARGGSRGWINAESNQENRLRRCSRSQRRRGDARVRLPRRGRADRFHRRPRPRVVPHEAQYRACAA